MALPWDTEVSRLHAELECIADEWTVSDDGLSRNGTFVNGSRISGRQRLRDGDVVRVGRTVLAYRRPASEDSRPTQIAGEQLALADLPPTAAPGPRRARAAVQARRVRHAGDQPGRSPTSCTSASTRSSRTCASLFRRFGIEHLPQNQKRSRLVAEALQQGLVSTRDL